MASGYTAFISYMLVPESFNSLAYGYSKFIHCNYIKSLPLNTSNPYLQDIAISFQDADDFKFLDPNINNGTGYTAHKIYGLIQLVNNSGFTSTSGVTSNPANWKIYDLTPQIKTHISGNTLTASGLTSQVFKIPLSNYNTYSTYNLHDFIKYPISGSSSNDDLCFGSEQFFLGNVSTEIKATAYTTDISILLPFNEFNASTNSTWTQQDKVVITEIGIYDANKNLVAIGKLNNPILKDSTVSRTIAFELDF